MVLGFFLDFLFPKRCVHCRSFGVYFCNSCRAKIEPIRFTICPMCERQAVDGVTHPGCRTRYSLDGLISFYRYDGPVKAAIKRLKYKPYIADLVDCLLPSILSTIEGKEDRQKLGKFNGFTLVAVPLHSQRERERGFNQASLIGKAIAKELRLEFVNGVLKRTRNTKPQVELKGKDRRENVVDAFAVNKNYTLYAKRYVLLVDDVWTTGSTMRVCANVLKRAGAKEVWAMTIAR